MSLTSLLPSMWTVLIMLFVFSAIDIGQNMHKINPQTDIYNYTKTYTSVWSNISTNLAAQEITVNNYSTPEKAVTSHITVAVMKLMNGIGGAAMEIFSAGVEYGFNTPSFDAGSVVEILKYLIYAIIISLVLYPAIFLLGLWFYILKWAYNGIKEIISWAG